MKKLIFIMAVTISGQIMAQSAAIVLFAKKTFIVNSKRGQFTSKRGDKLNAGDSIKVQKKGLSKLKYNNGTIVTLGSDTEYKILAYAPSQADVQIKAELKKGRLESITSGKKNSKELLMTPTVAFAILGTQYKSFVQGTTTYAQVDSGEVYAGDQLLQNGVGYKVSPEGIEAAPFPGSGNISTSADVGDADASGVDAVDADATTSDAANQEASASIASETNLVATTAVASTSVDQVPPAAAATAPPENITLNISITDCTIP